MMQVLQRESQILDEADGKENHQPSSLLKTPTTTSPINTNKAFPSSKFKFEESPTAHPLQTFQQPEEIKKPPHPSDANTTLKEGIDEEVKTSMGEGDKSIQMQQEKETSITAQYQSSEVDSRQPAAKLEDQNPPKQLKIHQQPKEQEKLMMIREGQYSRNRVYLYGWVRRECEKFKLQFETYANAVALMDEYYKYESFEKDRFVMTALCLIIASSKAFEPKVLYTSAVADVNKFNYQQMLKLQTEILTWFEFRVAEYNFVHVASEFMRRWDAAVRAVEPWRKTYLFFEAEPLSYIQYMEVLLLCENHIKQKGSLLQPVIKRIFQSVLIPRCKGVDAPAIIEKIFTEPCKEASSEYLFAYDIKNESEEVLANSLAEWRKQFQEKTRPELCRTFSTYQEEKEKYKCYGEFLCLLHP